jgi:hypothetical protein
MRTLTILLVLFLLACGRNNDATNAPPADAMTLFVSSQPMLCSGVGTQWCLRVREKQDGEWQLFYETIEGFMYEEGFQYEILVRKIAVPNPPADGAAWRYLLVKEVKKAKDINTILNSATRIDIWMKGMLDAVATTQPIEKVMKEGSKTNLVSIYGVGEKPSVIRMLDATSKATTEFFFKENDVVLYRVVTTPPNANEKRFYFYGKQLLESRIANLQGENQPITFQQYEKSKTNNDLGFSFNQVQQLAYQCLLAK